MASRSLWMKASARCQHALIARRRDDFHRAAHKARGADALEEQIAGEIVAARLERLQRRVEQGFDLDEGARRRRHAALDREPHALGLHTETPAVDTVDAQHEAVGVLAFFAQLDKARDGDAGRGETQHRMIDASGLDGGDRKARRNSENAERYHKADMSASQHDGARRTNRRQRQRRPPGRLTLGREVDNDAKTVGDREPRQQPSRGDFLQRPVADACRNGEVEARPGRTPRCAPRRAPRRTHAADRPGFFACRCTAFGFAVLIHCAGPARR